MNWFARTKPSLDGGEKRSIGAGIFRRCEGCGETHLAEVLEHNLEVCPHCGHAGRLSTERWLQILLDPGSFVTLADDMVPEDPLEFSDGRRYPERVVSSQHTTGVREAAVMGRAAIDGRGIVLGAFVFRFMGGSMGSVVGEKITRVFELAAAERKPAVVLSASGGARMQEGIFSLMQMAKTVSALGRLRTAGAPFVSVLLHPTTGGVAASYALLGDVNIAEPHALIGFAGPRVIEQTIRQKLPEGFQRSEFLLEHGMIDLIAERHAMRATLSRVIEHLVG